MYSTSSAEQPQSANAATSREATLMGMSVDPLHMARATDPLTSHEAAEAAAVFVGRHQWMVLEAIRHAGKAGAEEIGALIGMPAYAVRKRTSELERAGLIRDTGATRKTVSGRSERVWGAV